MSECRSNAVAWRTCSMSLALAFVTDCHLDVTLTPAKVEIDGTAIQALEIGARAMAEAPTSSGIQMANSGHLDTGPWTVN